MIDILGPPVSLKIKKENRYKSATGGLLTLLFVILSTLAFVAFGKDIFQKKMPVVNYNKIISSDYNETYFLLTDENFAFTLLHQKNSSAVEDMERKFHFYLNVYDNFDTGYTDTLYTFERCDKDRMQRIKNQLRTSPENYWCLPKNTTIEVKGVFLVGRFTSTRLNVDFCDNVKTNRTDCFPKNKTKSNLGNIQMNIIFDEYYTDSINYDQPFNKTYYSDNILSTASTFSRQIFSIKTIEYNTDEGWILENLKTESRNAIDTATLSLIPSPETNTIYSHMFINSKWRDVYKRSYIKIQGVFAYIGGFISLSLQILGLVCEYFIHTDLLKLFSDKYFVKFKENIFPHKLDHSTDKLKSAKSNIVNNFQMILNEENKSASINNFFNKVRTKKNYSVKSKQEDLSPCEKITKNLCCKSNKLKEKVSQFIQIEDVYNKKISIENITKMSRNLHLMSFLLLDENHRKLMKILEIQKETNKIQENDIRNLILDLETKIEDSNPHLNKNFLLCLNK